MGAQSRQPKVFPELPVGFREVFIFEAFAFFKDEDGVALFRQSHRGDTSSEAASNNYVIKAVSHQRSALSVFKSDASMRLTSSTSLWSFSYVSFGRNSRSRARMSGYSVSLAEPIAICKNLAKSASVFRP